jgi:hypothetical protein
MNFNWKKHVMRSIVIGGIVEIVLYLLFLYYQPQCVPCQPGAPCPPCRSDEQDVIVKLFFYVPFLVVLNITVQYFINFFRSKSDNAT